MACCYANPFFPVSLHVLYISSLLFLCATTERRKQRKRKGTLSDITIHLSHFSFCDPLHRLLDRQPTAQLLSEEESDSSCESPPHRLHLSGTDDSDAEEAEKRREAARVEAAKKAEEERKRIEESRVLCVKCGKDVTAEDGNTGEPGMHVNNTV